MTRSCLCSAAIFASLVLPACGSSQTEQAANATAAGEGNAAGNVVVNRGAAEPVDNEASLDADVRAGPPPLAGSAPEPTGAPPTPPVPPDNSQEPEPVLEHEYMNRNQQRADPPG